MKKARAKGEKTATRGSCYINRLQGLNPNEHAASSRLWGNLSHRPGFNPGPHLGSGFMMGGMMKHCVCITTERVPSLDPSRRRLVAAPQEGLGSTEGIRFDPAMVPPAPDQVRGIRGKRRRRTPHPEIALQFPSSPKGEVKIRTRREIASPWGEAGIRSREFRVRGPRSPLAPRFAMCARLKETP